MSWIGEQVERARDGEAERAARRAVVSFMMKDGLSSIAKQSQWKREGTPDRQKLDCRSCPSYTARSKLDSRPGGARHRSSFSEENLACIAEESGSNEPLTAEDGAVLVPLPLQSADL